MSEPIVGGKSEFIFTDAMDTLRDRESIVVRLPRGIRSKKKMFAVFADKLHFPRYFGWNWDAFEECLCDLSWLKAGRSIAIMHDDLPFGQGGINRGIYLNLLRDSLHHWSSAGGRNVQVIFPAPLQDRVSASTNAPR